jgi:hypothetical protein
MILNFLGTAGISSLTKILDHKKELLIEAEKLKNDARRIQLEREIKQLEAEIAVKQMQKELGLADRKSFFFRLWCYTLVAAVMLYWSARFFVRLLGADIDYGIFVSDLSPEEIIISTMVTGYVFLKSG